MLSMRTLEVPRVQGLQASGMEVGALGKQYGCGLPVEGEKPQHHFQRER